MVPLSSSPSSSSPAGLSPRSAALLWAWGARGAAPTPLAVHRPSKASLLEPPAQQRHPALEQHPLGEEDKPHRLSGTTLTKFEKVVKFTEC